VDRAGVDRALRYERSAGREPEEMPHNNPGYDVVSRVDGQIARYIEVKSIQGLWLDHHQGLSGPQHNFAVMQRGRFWLYVVERAGREDEEIYAIQDPVGRADIFGYDPGWAHFAEGTDGATAGMADSTLIPALGILER
jgi:hypothetical protein